VPDAPTKNVGTGSYIIAGLGFIPGIGIFFAVIAIIVGFAKLNGGGRRLIILGCLGIAFSAVLYGTLFYLSFVVRGGIFDELRGQLAKSTITNLVRNIEYYKVAKGQYPNSLLELQSSLGTESFVFIHDPTIAPGSKEMSTFFYRLTGDRMHYYLRSVGLDQKPFTGDDILPNLPEQERLRTGLLLNPASAS
jgi:hypothetical protein